VLKEASEKQEEWRKAPIKDGRSWITILKNNTLISLQIVKLVKTKPKVRKLVKLYLKGKEILSMTTKVYILPIHHNY